MESILYIVSIFSEELLLFQGAFITIMVTAYFAYLILKKRRYGVFNKNTSAFVVKEYLNEVIGETEEIRNQLFGILNGDEPTLSQRPKREPKLNAETASSATSIESASATPQAAPPPVSIDTEKLTALEKQLSELTAKATQLEKDKKDLEEKLKTQPAGEALSGDAAELASKMKGLEDRLAEYSIIEDDLANLKKLQQENAQLKAALDAKGGAPISKDPPPPAETEAVVEPAKEEKAEEPTPAEQSAAAETSAPLENETPNFDELVDNVEKSLEVKPSEATPEKNTEIKPVEATPEKNTEIKPGPAPVTQETKVEEPKKEEPKAAAADSGNKDDEDLLKEFERMLNV